MRQVQTSHAPENYVLAADIYDRSGRLMYRKGTPVTVFVKTRIFLEEHETIPVYESALEYQLEEIIRPDIQEKTMQQLRHLDSISTISEASGDPGEKPHEEAVNLNVLRAMVGSIVEEFLRETAVMERLAGMKKAHEYLYTHSVGVMTTSLLLGTSLGLERDALHSLGLSAILHDVGMLMIPAHILKQETLTEAQYRLVQEHVVLGYEFLRDHTNLPEPVLMPVYHHQERWDGTGYPQGISGDDINFHGQIIGLADMFDSMTSDRPHRKAFPVSEAYEFIMAQGGYQFNPRLVQTFITNINPYPLNMLVELDDGNIGVVERTNSPFHSRPVVRIVQGPNRGGRINLLEQRNRVIRKTLKKKE